MATPQPGDPAPKQIHSLVLDTGPLIKNDPPANTLRAKAEQLYTLPCIISEIRDAATRSRVETTLLPFITLRSPRPQSVKFIRDFARRTGDLSVLSRPDIEVLALGYELECERNGGDWRLRNMPGQKGLNGKPPQKKEEGDSAAPAADEKIPEIESNTEEKPAEEKTAEQSLDESVQNLTLESEPTQAGEEGTTTAESSDEAQTDTPTLADQAIEIEEEEEDDEDDGAPSDDEGGWITPSNLKKHQAKDPLSSSPSQPLQKTLQAAVLTSDYAMQNVALRMNLNLVAPSLARITTLKSWVLRCHGCFTVCKDTSRQFCPSCGQPTLMRVSCSTDEHGVFKLHLKRNFQWNNRGNVYSVPKPVHGSSNGRLPKNAGGQNNWGNGLILAEDQKEYTRANDEQRRARKKDLMDQDYLPNILSGDRSGSSGKIRVGAGRRVNSKRKH